MENLNNKIWYRFLKVVFITSFLVLQIGPIVFILEDGEIFLGIALFLFISFIFWLISRGFFYIFTKEKFLAGKLINTIKNFL